MIRVVLVDDHTAVRAGLLALVRAEPGLQPIACVGTCAEALSSAQRFGVDVALVDYHLPDGDGLSLCRKLKRLDPAPAVLVYSAYAGGPLSVASLVAGADGMLTKGAPADELFDAIRSVARRRMLPGVIAHDHVALAAAALEPEDQPILGMLLEDTPVPEIANTLRLPLQELEHRIDSMLHTLKPPLERVETTIS